LAHPRDYHARANVMWCATMALNGLIAVGVPQDWATHMIGHELTALHDLDHARTLAVVLPSLLSVRRQAKGEKLLQYGERIWNITQGTEYQRMDQTIQKTRDFFESVGVPTRLSAYGIGPETAAVVARRLRERGSPAFGERKDIGPDVVEEILTLSA